MRMIAATIKSCVQTGEDTFQDRLWTYVFDETATIEHILKITKQEDISECNLSMVKSFPVDLLEEDKNGN